MSVDQIVQLIQSAIQFGTVILFGAMGEIQMCIRDRGLSAPRAPRRPWTPLGPASRTAA